MGVLRRHHLNHHHHHSHLLPKLTFFTLLFIASPLTLAQLGGGETDQKEGSKLDRFLIQKRFGGPGSSPPTCRSKCGWCSPCKPVHVPIQPGVSMPLEYYPEAWRCKCGNKLYDP